MTAPRQKPGRSKQDYGTPLAFVRACEKRWGPFAIDLAADFENKKAPQWIDKETNALEASWPRGVLCWLNPPFESLGAWAETCAYNAKRGSRIIMLSPASVGTEWYARYVHMAAGVVFLRPRLTFEGCTDPYPKDLMLTLWGIQRAEFECWRWDGAL